GNPPPHPRILSCEALKVRRLIEGEVLFPIAHPRSSGSAETMSRRLRGRGARRPMAFASAAAVAAGLLLSVAPSHAAESWQPDSGYTSTDKGDGTYSAPLFNADVPDVSVERIAASENDEGRDIYYMISTTM